MAAADGAPLLVAGADISHDEKLQMTEQMVAVFIACFALGFLLNRFMHRGRR